MAALLGGGKKADKEDDEPAFSLELLDLYYRRLFPYDHMFRWLSYGNAEKGNPGAVKDYFFRREWSFTLAGTQRPNENEKKCRIKVCDQK